jgi:hypothetical protein
MNTHSETPKLFYVMRRREAGWSFDRIANALNAMGIRGDKGGLWYGATVRRFIQKNQLNSNADYL